MSEHQKFDKIAERIFWIFAIFTILIFIVGSVGTAIARKTISPDIELIPVSLLNFHEHVLWVFVLPVSLKIGGDKLPELVAAFKGNPLQNQMYSNQYGYGQNYPMTGYPQPDSVFNPNIHQDGQRQE